MKFDNKSFKLLSITKSKAKMYEFGLDEEHHIHLAESPSELLFMTIGILGDLCRDELSKEVDPEHIKLRRLELRNAARYFDALIGSKLQSHYDYYLCLLGAASYYLADMPGSSAVLANKVQERQPLTSSGLENVLIWLLHGQKGPQIYKEGAPIQEKVNSLYYNIARYMSGKSSAGKLTEYQGVTRWLVGEIRTHFHENGTDRELLIADIIAAVVTKKLKNSSVNLLPQYTGIELEQWLPALAKDTFISELWPAQQLLGEAGVFRGNSAVIQLPTSAGKTKSAELIIRSAFLSKRASTAVIIAPFRSLCREISESLRVSFSNEVLINQLSDIPQIDEFDTALFSQIFEGESSAGECNSIVVATPEKFVYLLRHKPELAELISLVIYDEGHQFDTGSRGVTYELLLTSLKRSLRDGTQHVLISAVLANAESIGDWLYAGDGEVVNGANMLSTERSIAFTSWERKLGQFHYIDALNPNTQEYFVPRVLESLPIPLMGNETAQKYFPPKSDKTLVAGYIGLKLAAQGPVAIFCGQKSSVIKICRDLLKPLERIPSLKEPILNSNKDEIEKIGRLSECHFGELFTVTKAIRKGILPHSSNIPNGLRVSIEYAMERGYGRYVVCTSTLAQGVNLPIKFLVVSGVFQGQKLISTRDFHNLAGRAGRAGIHTEGSIVFADTELFDQRLAGKSRQWAQIATLLDPTQAEHCKSSLLTLVQPFDDTPLDIDPMKFINAPEKYEKLCLRAIEQNGEDLSNLLKQMGHRVNYLKSLESFLLANSTIPNEELFGELMSGTFAYSIATDEEKKRLTMLFEIIASRISDIQPEKRSAYGKALLGIYELEAIEEWLEQNSQQLNEELSIENTLEVVWPIIEKLSLNGRLGKIIGEDAALSIAKWWCTGVPYLEILKRTGQSNFKIKAKTQQRALKMENLVEICDASLGYESMMIVGACADLLEELLNMPELAEKLRKLQISLRIGIDDELEKWVYASGITDRHIARAVSGVIKNNVDSVDVINGKVFNTLKNEISEELSHYPSAFYNAVYG